MVAPSRSIFKRYALDQDDKKKLAELYEHAAALEIELARYAAKYGLTDEARRLLSNSPWKHPLMP